MIKTKYIYEHKIHKKTHVSGNKKFPLGRKEMPEFFQKSGIKLHVDMENDYFYTWEYAGKECSWYEFVRKEEVDVKPTVTKLPMDNKYENGFNWKNAHLKRANSRLRKKK